MEKDKENKKQSLSLEEYLKKVEALMKLANKKAIDPNRVKISDKGFIL